MSSFRLVVALVALLLLAACTNPVPGTGSVAEVAPLNGREVLGDVDRVDYCSLVDDWDAVTGIASAGGVWSDFNACFVRARADDTGGWFRVNLGFLVDEQGVTVVEEPGQEVELPGGIAWQRYEGGGTEQCVHYLVFADDLSLEVSAELEDAEVADVAHDILCDYVTDVVRGVLDTVYDGEVGRLTFGEGSFGEADACDLLSDDEVGAAFGNPVTSYPEVTDHLCAWWSDSDEDVPTLYVGFESVDELDVLPEETIGGRRGFVTTGADGSCVAITPHIRWNNGDAPGTEIAVIETPGKGGSCDAVRQLAETAFPRLPQVPAQ